MKTIDTLIDDIQDMLANGLPDIPEELVLEFEKSFSGTLRRQLTPVENKATLRMSNIGNPCERKLWYTVNEADNPAREKIRGDTRFKFLYGDLTEELILLFASLAGHKVEGRQDEQEIAGIKGHQDAIIDGCVVDVKSASTYAFKKFKEGRLLEDDPFGYHVQLMSYLYAGQDDERVVEKDKAYFLVFDKQLGHMCLDEHRKPDWFYDFPEMYERRKEMVAGELPRRTFQPVPDGKSGNMKLDMFCSYCEFKRVCHPGLRTFIYSNGPRYLTTVSKLPDVTEVDE